MIARPPLQPTNLKCQVSQASEKQGAARSGEKNIHREGWRSLTQDAPATTLLLRRLLLVFRSRGNEISLKDKQMEIDENNKQQQEVL